MLLLRPQRQQLMSFANPFQAACPASHHPVQPQTETGRKAWEALLIFQKVEALQLEAAKGGCPSFDLSSFIDSPYDNPNSGLPVWHAMRLPDTP